MTDTVLVTGGNGFLGSHACRTLAEAGYRVVAYDMATPRRFNLHIQARQAGEIEDAIGDITDLSRLLWVCRQQNVCGIVHTAGSVDVESSVERPSQTYQVNTFGSIVVYEAVRLLGLRRVVLISSNAVYGDVVADPMDEQHPVFSVKTGNAAAHYGASKLAAELIGLTYARHNAVDLVALRTSAVYGFGMQRALYVKPFVEAAVAGRAANFPRGGEMKRDYSYVKDVAQCIRLAFEVPSERLTQRVFNVSGGRMHTALEVVETVRSVVPGADISIGSGLSAMEEADIKPRAALDCRQAEEGLGFRSVHDLRSGIEDYVRDLRAYLDDAGSVSE